MIHKCVGAGNVITWWRTAHWEQSWSFIQKNYSTYHLTINNLFLKCAWENPDLLLEFCCSPFHPTYIQSNNNILTGGDKRSLICVSRHVQIKLWNYCSDVQELKHQVEKQKKACHTETTIIHVAQLPWLVPVTLLGPVQAHMTHSAPPFPAELYRYKTSGTKVGWYNQHALLSVLTHTLRGHLSQMP